MKDKTPLLCDAQEAAPHSSGVYPAEKG